MCSKECGGGERFRKRPLKITAARLWCSGSLGDYQYEYEDTSTMTCVLMEPCNKQSCEGVSISKKWTSCIFRIIRTLQIKNNSNCTFRDSIEMHKRKRSVWRFFYKLWHLLWWSCMRGSPNIYLQKATQKQVTSRNPIEMRKRRRILWRFFGPCLLLWWFYMPNSPIG